MLRTFEAAELGAEMAAEVVVASEETLGIVAIVLSSPGISEGISLWQGVRTHVLFLLRLPQPQSSPRPLLYVEDCRVFAARMYGNVAPLVLCWIT